MPSASNSDTIAGQHIQNLRAIAAGTICAVIMVARPRARITAVPGAGATMRVFKSSSPQGLIQADADAGRLCSAKANSKAVDLSSDAKQVAGVAVSGTSNVKPIGGMPGGGTHRIKLAANQSNTDQSTNGYGLHIGGAILVRDR